MLREIDNNIWIAEQPLKYWGLEVGTRMTVIRLTTGELIVISPIQSDKTTIHQLNEIGNVAYIIAPNLYHHLFVYDLKSIYREAQLWGVPGLVSKRPELSFDRVITNKEGSIKEQVDYLLFDGFKLLDLSGPSIVNEFVFFHQKSRTLILTDIAFHFDETFSFKTRLAAQFLGSYKVLSPSRLDKLATSDKEKVKDSVEKILRWDFNRVIMAHGSIIETNGKQKFKQGYEWVFENTSLSKKS
ncbi:DUF4336 domain-containing protein [Brasilonema bromeliae]|uniref:DUF4336 domain-containing protein n=1 Tax=Brasilonema bromeliae SPC951 TaxID=385972 RepID=A0ABX1PBZ8_9CYAN|nr:DUF4336 domain-containing protein [Brasilonema bromeliae]NMG21020.1 hypothetical protein [Brasilonema bromeliae SPC951]